MLRLIKWYDRSMLMITVANRMPHPKTIKLLICVMYVSTIFFYYNLTKMKLSSRLNDNNKKNQYEITIKPPNQG